MTDWQKAESDIRERLGLEGTSGSGNKWYDIGDSVDHSHFTEVVFPLLVESKATRHKSYSIVREYVQDYWERSVMRGKRFLLHTQFQEEVGSGVEDPQRDWVTLTLDDFAELYELASRSQQVKSTDTTPGRTEEEDEAVRMFQLLIQHIPSSETRVKYYQWWDQIEKHLPSLEVSP